jgi:hypothetical protein
MVWAEGLRVWRSCKNSVNQAGNDSASNASVPGPAWTTRRAGSELSITPSGYQSKRWIILSIKQEETVARLYISRAIGQWGSVTVTKPRSTPA